MIDNRPKMLVIDGSSVLTTCYYANLPLAIKQAKTEEEKEALYEQILHSHDGIYTNGILGFCKILMRFLNEWRPDYVVAVFDKSRKTTFRRKMYPEYKEQRGKTAKPLSDQLILIQQILTECGIPVLRSDLYEADDLAGSITEKYKTSMQIMLLTKDRDYLQLVDDIRNVKCMIMAEADKAEQFRQDYGIPKPVEYCFQNLMEFTDARVFSEKGVHPINITDLKALEGDTSDNIPGVRGISAAVAAPLITHYGNIESLYTVIKATPTAKDQKELSAKWKEEFGFNRSPINALLKGEESAVLSKDLATIRRNIEIPDITAYRATNFGRAHFRTWMDRLDIQSIKVEGPSL